MTPERFAALPRGARVVLVAPTPSSGLDGLAVGMVGALVYSVGNIDAYRSVSWPMGIVSVLWHEVEELP